MKAEVKAATEICNQREAAGMNQFDIHFTPYTREEEEQFQETVAREQKTYLCGVKGFDNSEYFHEIKADSPDAALEKLKAMMSKEAHSPRVIREIEPESSIFDIIEEDE